MIIPHLCFYLSERLAIITSSNAADRIESKPGRPHPAPPQEDGPHQGGQEPTGLVYHRGPGAAQHLRAEGAQGNDGLLGESGEE